MLFLNHYISFLLLSTIVLFNFTSLVAASGQGGGLSMQDSPWEATLAVVFGPGKGKGEDDRDPWDGRNTWIARLVPLYTFGMFTFLCYADKI